MSTVRERKKTEELVSLYAAVIAETEKAYCVDNGMDEFWIPKSQLQNVDIRDTNITCELPHWLAKDKGIV